MGKKSFWHQLGAVSIGTIVAIIAFIGLLIADFFVRASFGWYGPIARADVIAVGSGYSVAIKSKPAHPWLAEYDNTVEIYSGGRVDGHKVHTVPIRENTGGRIRIGLFVPNTPDVDSIYLLQRGGLTTVKLANGQAHFPSYNIQNAPEDLTFLGWISGESYPLKFIPCQVWSTLSEQDRADIVNDRDDLLDLCDRYSLG